MMRIIWNSDSSRSNQNCCLLNLLFGCCWCCYCTVTQYICESELNRTEPNQTEIHKLFKNSTVDKKRKTNPVFISRFRQPTESIACSTSFFLLFLLLLLLDHTILLYYGSYHFFLFVNKQESIFWRRRKRKIALNLTHAKKWTG